jgi:hypothetical protein
MVFFRLKAVILTIIGKHMNDHFELLKEDKKELIITRLCELLGENREVVSKLYPIWNSIVLASILKLSRNRIRFSALQNFIQKDSFPSKDFELFVLGVDKNYSLDNINHYGDSLIGVLIPDKRSALANSMSNDLAVRSSLILKGLSIMYTLYGEFLSNDGADLLKDWKSFVEYFGAFKNNLFDSTVPVRVQKSISEILILVDIYKETPLMNLSEESELNLVSMSDNVGFWDRYKVFLIGFLLLSLTAGGIYWYVQQKSEEEIVPEKTLEVIPMDSLNKLSDSLTKSVLDSVQLSTDSTVTITWPKGKAFSVPKSSVIYQIHQYLSDSTISDSFHATCFEISFENNSEQLISKNPDFFKRLVEGLNRYKKVNIRLYTFSDNGETSDNKRGFLLKNRLVGEGLSPKRIEVKTGKNPFDLDASKAANEQVVLELLKQ